MVHLRHNYTRPFVEDDYYPFPNENLHDILLKTEGTFKLSLSFRIWLSDRLLRGRTRVADDYPPHISCMLPDPASTLSVLGAKALVAIIVSSQDSHVILKAMRQRIDPTPWHHSTPCTTENGLQKVSQHLHYSPWGLPEDQPVERLDLAG